LNKFITLRYWILILLAVFILTISSGIGTGVPLLNILFGFLAGWYAARRAQALYGDRKRILQKIFIYSLFCAGVSLVIMLAIWARTIPLLFDPAADIANFGHPMILYEPRMSFIGWLVLMIIISPILQLMASIFSAFITLMAAQPGTLKE